MHYQTGTTLLLASTLVVSAAGAAVPLPMRRLMSQQKMERDLEVSPKYDEDHSQHWNYHKGYVNKDGHGHGPPHRRAEAPRAHRLSRRAISLLPGDGAIIESDGDYYASGINGGLEIDLHKRHQHHSEKVVKQDGSVINLTANLKEKRHDHWDYSHSDHWNEHHGRVHHHSHAKRHDHDHEHEHGHVHGHYDEHGHWHSRHHGKRDGEQGHIEERSHDDHHHHHHHDHDHDHDHVHEHVHIHDKRHKDKEAKKKGGKKNTKGKSFIKHFGKAGKGSDGKESKSGGDKKEEKRDMSAGLQAAGTPGFVEVATHLFNSTLARSIAGLVFSSNPDATAESVGPESFLLGTSNAQSTQFYLTPDETGSNSVNIRIPILNAQQLSTTDYCATFDLTPPSPLSLQPCGKKEGFSQSFAYNSETSELQPLYASTPAPMALVDTDSIMERSRTLLATPDDSNSTTASSSSNSMPASSSAPSTMSSSPPVASGSPMPASPSANSTDSTESGAQTISLFFVPASTYYKAPVGVQALFDTNQADVATPPASMDSSSSQNSTMTDDGLMDGTSTLNTTPSPMSPDPASTAPMAATATPSSSGAPSSSAIGATASANSTPMATPSPAPSSASQEISDSPLSTVTVSPAMSQSAASQSGTSVSAKFARW